MNLREICSKLEDRFPDKVEFIEAEAGDSFIKVQPESIAEIAGFLKSDSTLLFDGLMCLTAVDFEENYTLVYNLCSYENGYRCNLRVELPKENPTVPTVEDIWKTANWHEREAWDLMGVSFEGHSDMRRILLPDDWEGHPLRKDYKFPREWHGMMANTSESPK